MKKILRSSETLWEVFESIMITLLKYKESYASIFDMRGWWGVVLNLSLILNLWPVKQVKVFNKHLKDILVHTTPWQYEWVWCSLKNCLFIKTSPAMQPCAWYSHTCICSVMLALVTLSTWIIGVLRKVYNLYLEGLISFYLHKIKGTNTVSCPFRW